MIKYLEARKKVDEKVDGEFETIKFHVKKIEHKNMQKAIVDACEEYEDYEEAHSKGIYYSWEELYSIDVNIFLEHLGERLVGLLEEDYIEEDQKIIEARSVIKFLEAWKGYDIYFKDGEVKNE